MHRIIALSLCAALALATDIPVPLAMFDADAAQPTLDGAAVAVEGGIIRLPVGKEVVVGWAVRGQATQVAVFAVDRTSPTHAPDWAGEPTAGFAGSDRLVFARERATSAARIALLRQAAGGGAVQASGTVSSGRTEMVITIAADAAEQPAYVVPEGPMRMMRQSSADGKAGRPWMRCWARILDARVELNPHPAKP